MSKTANSISWSKVSIENFDITKPDDNDRVPAQKLSYIRYKSKGRVGQLHMKTPRIQNTSGGIPQEGPFYPDDMKRAKGYKIPFNKSNPDEIDYYNKMKELDDWFSSEQFRKDVLGWSEKISQGYDYTPIVRLPQEVEEEEIDEHTDPEKIKSIKQLKEKREKMGPRPDYMKSYFELEYQTNRVLVKIIEKQGEEKKTVDDVNVLDDALKYINYMGFCKYILTPNKLYATKNKDKNGRKQYGVTWKTICVEAEPSEKNSKQELPDDPFISDDEDEDHNIANKITKMNLKEVEEIEQIDYGTVNEEEQEEEEEIVDVKPKIKVKASKESIEENLNETKTKKSKKNSSA